MFPIPPLPHGSFFRFIAANLSLTHFVTWDRSRYSVYRICQHPIRKYLKEKQLSIFIDTTPFSYCWKLSIQFPCLLRYATLFLPHIVCYFPPVCLNAVPAPSSGVVSLTLRKRGHRKIVSHSAGHSVVTDFWATKKPVHKRIPT